MPAPLLQSVSVRDLARFVTRLGDLGSSWRSATRGWEGIRAHQRVLENRPEGYLREKSVRLEQVFPDFTLRVDGRVDGMLDSPEQLLIEEVKSTRMDLGRAHPDEPVHMSQARLYAGLLAREFPRPRILVRLIYTHLDTGEEAVVEESLSPAQATRYLEDAVEDYAGWCARVLEWHQDARVAARSAAWPFPQWRRGQELLVEAVTRAVQRQSTLLAEAPTGLGKTAATLFAAARALAAREVEKVFYLTARNSGKKSARDALNRLRASGFRIKSVEITAREKACDLAGGPCPGALCPGAAGYYERVRDALEDAFDGPDDWSRESIRALAHKHGLCAYEFSLDLATWADVIICDYNYVWDPQAYLRRFFGEERHEILLLVDEAHNLPSRARDMFSPSWDGRAWMPAADRLALEAPMLAREIRAFSRHLLDFFGTHSTPAKPWVVQPEAPPELAQGLRRLCAIMDGWLSREAPSDHRLLVQKMNREAMSMLAGFDRMDSRHLFLVDTVGEGEMRARVFCRDPSALLAKQTAKARAAVFFSATLRPADYFRDQLGIDPLGSETLTLESPFPPENLRVTLDTTLNTTFRNRAVSTAEIAARIRAFTGELPGNTLVFFPSFSFLNEVAAHFELEVGFGRVILQRPRMREEERAAFLARFEQVHPQGLAGFAVLGGVFSEGVDLPGERLTGVVVVGTGLPQVCLEQELIRAWFDEQGKPGFDYAYTFPGFNRVLQAAGRVIRTEEDTGRALLLDHRYATPRYHELFPTHWRGIQGAEGFNLESEPQWME